MTKQEKVEVTEALDAALLLHKSGNVGAAAAPEGVVTAFDDSRARAIEALHAWRAELPDSADERIMADCS